MKATIRLIALIPIITLIFLIRCTENESHPPGIPKLSAPPNNNIDQTLNPAFTWQPSSNAQTYGFQLSSSQEFTSMVKDTSSISGVSISIKNLNPSTKYFWRVNAKNSSGTSPWSDIWGFTTKLLGPPVLISPANSSIVFGNSTLLQWSAIPDALGYELEVSPMTDFSTITISKTNITSTTTTIFNLPTGTKYYWRVRATKNSFKSSWSDVWSFNQKLPIPINGLIASYPFNGSAIDESENANNGIVSNASLSIDRNGNVNQAYAFNGVDSYIHVPNSNSLNLIGDLTISVWFKSDGCTTPCSVPGYHTIIMKRDVSQGPGDDWPWGLSISYLQTVLPDGVGQEFQKLMGSRRSNGAQEDGFSQSSITLNTWQHVIMMVNNDVQTIYLNNVLTGTHTYSMSQLSNAKDLLIGWSLRGGGYEIFKGQIDDIRIYNRVLTDIEILALYQE